MHGGPGVEKMGGRGREERDVYRWVLYNYFTPLSLAMLYLSFVLCITTPPGRPGVFGNGGEGRERLYIFV